MADSRVFRPPNADSLAEAAAAAAKGGLPPVERWTPPYCGEIDMEIAADGTWYYQGSPIGRMPLVKLFSRILLREGDRYFLVTPAEKVGIRVQDAPFVAVDFEAGPEGIDFVTNVGDHVAAGPDRPIRVEHDASGTPRPYVLVRRNLWALIDRKSFYRLAELCAPGEHDGRRWLGLRSRGGFFPVLPEEEVPVA